MSTTTVSSGQSLLDAGHELAQAILEQDYQLSPADLLHLFQLVQTPYPFPTLMVDEEGIVTGASEFFDKFDRFILLPEEWAYRHELAHPDREIEDFLRQNKVKQVRIDLRQNRTGIFSTHQSFLYPPSLAQCPPIYDTLYLTDYLLKHIYRFLMASLIHGTDPEVILAQTYLIGIRQVEGSFAVSSVQFRYEFMRLIDLVSQYVDRNGLAGQRKQLHEEYLESRRDKVSMSAAIHYQDIGYTWEDNVLTLSKLKERVVLTASIEGDCVAPPQYAQHLITFFEQYYDDIKDIFPIYHRLENIYRLCALNVFLEHREDILSGREISTLLAVPESVYIHTFPRAILCSGGILLAPLRFFQKKLKEAQENDYTCREAFDNGGFLCTLAQRRLIKECLSKNEKDYHDCLASREK